MATNPRERYPRAASQNSRRPGGYSAASTLPEPKTSLSVSLQTISNARLIRRSLGDHDADANLCEKRQHLPLLHRVL
jgi:hypothetical protein